MQKYSEMSKEQLQAVKKELDQQYAEIKAQGLALDMSVSYTHLTLPTNSLV